MQLESYGPSQPDEDLPRIPRTRERAKANNGSNTHARERENQRSYKNGGIVHAKGTWGGARNRKDRVTTALKQEHAEGLLKAMAVAELRGMPLNRHWTVDYELAGIDDSDGAAFVGKLLRNVSLHARRRGGIFAAVWVREVGLRNGAHVHIAFHWPRGWKLGYLTRRWIKAAGGRYSKGVSKVRPIGASCNCAWTSRELYRENLERLGNYLTKGSDSDVAHELGLELLRPQGQIIGKRCGRTQNVGLKPQEVSNSSPQIR